MQKTIIDENFNAIATALAPAEPYGILYEEDGYPPIFVNKSAVAIGAVIKVGSMIADWIKSRKTNQWQEEVSASLERIEGKLDQVMLSIRQLGVHVTREINAALAESERRQLSAAISRYRAAYPAFTDAGYAKAESERILQSLEQWALVTLERKDMSDIALVSYSLAAHHDLMHFATRPISHRKGIYQLYLDYFGSSLDGTWTGSFESNIRRLTELRDNKVNEYNGHNPGSLNRAVGSASGGGYTFDLHIRSTFSRDSDWTVTESYATIASEPRPGGHGGGRGGGRDVSPMKALGEVVARNGECWGAGGPNCSQIWGPLNNWINSNVPPWNAKHRQIRGEMNTLKLLVERASEAIAMARPVFELSQDLAQDPNLYPPALPAT